MWSTSPKVLTSSSSADRVQCDLRRLVAGYYVIRFNRACPPSYRTPLPTSYVARDQVARIIYRRVVGKLYHVTTNGKSNTEGKSHFLPITHARTHAPTHARTHTHTHMLARVCLCARTHARTHKLTHTHTHAHQHVTPSNANVCR